MNQHTRVEPRPPRNQRFVVGSDHAGLELKEQIKNYLLEHGNEVDDLVGRFEGRIDWGPVAEKVCRRVLAEPGTYGILVCGTGLAMDMAANKVHGIRATLLYDDKAAEYARRHNDANVLVFGGRTMKFEDVRRRIEIFFSHQFEGGRYQRRNLYLSEIERSHLP